MEIIREDVNEKKRTIFYRWCTFPNFHLILIIHIIGIQYEHTASMCCNNNHIISRVYLQIMYICKGKITEYFIIFSSVLAYIYTCISTNIQDIIVNRVFPDDIYRANRYITGYISPRVAKIS